MKRAVDGDSVMISNGSQNRMDVGGRFTCKQCGRCCTTDGYVRLTAADIEALAAHLDLTVEGFVETHTTLTRDRQCLALHDATDGACYFYDPSCGCTVQEAKPQQCRDFPVKWRYREFDSICPGTFTTHPDMKGNDYE
jgi:Fe-S-cluster containining protein